MLSVFYLYHTPKTVLSIIGSMLFLEDHDHNPYIIVDFHGYRLSAAKLLIFLSFIFAMLTLFSRRWNQILRMYFANIKFHWVQLKTAISSIGYGARYSAILSVLDRKAPTFYRAVIIGVNYRNSRELPHLAGSIADAERVRNYLKYRLGVNVNDQTRVIYANDFRTPLTPTRKVILNAINWMETGVKPGDLVIFHYSGHGILDDRRRGRKAAATTTTTESQDIAYNENDDAANRGSRNVSECIVPIDVEIGAAVIDDNEMFERIVKPMQNTGATAWIECDCCYSGANLRLKYTYHCSSSGVIIMNVNDMFPELDDIMRRVNVVYIGASRSTETAGEVVSHVPDYSRPVGQADTDKLHIYGALTDAEYDKLDSGISDNDGLSSCTNRQLLQSIQRRFDQDYIDANEGVVDEKDRQDKQHVQLCSSRPLDLDARFMEFKFSDDTEMPALPTGSVTRSRTAAGAASANTVTKPTNVSRGVSGTTARTFVQSKAAATNTITNSVQKK